MRGLVSPQHINSSINLTGATGEGEVGECMRVTSAAIGNCSHAIVLLT